MLFHSQLQKKQERNITTLRGEANYITSFSIYEKVLCI